MHGARGFIAGAGASMSLVAAAVSALFVVSAVIAVRGWPGIAPSQDAGAPLVLDEGDALPGGAPAAPAEQAPILLASDDTTPVTARQLPLRRAPRLHRPGRTRPSPDTTGGISSPAPAATPEVPSVTRPIRDPVDQAGDALEPAAPGSGGVVGGPTDAVGDTVAGIGAGVGGVVEPVAPRSSRSIEDVTSAVGETVTDAGAVVDDLLTGLLGALVPPPPA